MWLIPKDDATPTSMIDLYSDHARNTSKKGAILFVHNNDKEEY